MGQTRIVFGDEVTMAFAMHDEGYLTLAPCTPFVRELEISHTEGSNIVTCAGGFVSHMKGQYLYFDGWKAIREVTDASTAILSEAAAGTGTTRTPIVTMNEIEVQGDGLALTRFEVEYTPRI